MKGNLNKLLKNIKEITRLTGLSSKTLRHWESVGLLKPQRDLANDYRLYSQADLNKIFYIMSLKALELPLSHIKSVLDRQQSEKESLKVHLDQLRSKQEQINQLIGQLENKLEKGDYQMSEEDFEHLKSRQIEENETEYGQEIRLEYGIEVVEQSNRKFLQQSEEGMAWASQTHHKIIQMLEDAYVTKNEQLAQAAVQLHQEWLEFHWPEGTLSAEAHIGLGQTYCDDVRFRANYNQKYDGLPEFFRDQIIKFYQ